MRQVGGSQGDGLSSDGGPQLLELPSQTGSPGAFLTSVLDTKLRPSVANSNMMRTQHTGWFNCYIIVVLVFQPAAIWGFFFFN